MKAAGASSLVAHGDRIDARKVAPPPFGIAASGSAAPSHSASMHSPTCPMISTCRTPG